VVLRWCHSAWQLRVHELPQSTKTMALVVGLGGDEGMEEQGRDWFWSMRLRFVWSDLSTSQTKHAVAQ
jgi:hypothetical protein